MAPQVFKTSVAGLSPAQIDSNFSSREIKIYAILKA